MLGAIIGDIVGSAWEFNPTNNYHFPLFTEKSSYTDDTITPSVHGSLAPSKPSTISDGSISH